MRFDLAIIGGGPGGYLAAIKAAQKGKNVCLIDKDKLGGVCLNWGCIPTKALIKNAEVYNYVKNSEKYGISIKDYSVDFKKNIKRSRNVSDRLSKGIEYLIKKNKVTHIKGKGILKSENKILVESQKKSIVLETDYIILAMGARPKSLPGLEFDYKRIISSKEAMVLDSIPKKIIIIGSGAIGCEFSYYFNEFGFVIIPIATSISTWVGVIIYLYILNSKSYLLLQNYLPTNILKIVFSTILMSFILLFAFDHYVNYLDYAYKYKSVYLMLIVSFVAGFYLISCYLTGVLKVKNFKIN